MSGKDDGMGCLMALAWWHFMGICGTVALIHQGDTEQGIGTAIITAIPAMVGLFFWVTKNYDRKGLARAADRRAPQRSTVAAARLREQFSLQQEPER